MSGFVNYVLATPKAFGTYVSNCLTQIRSTLGCRTPNTYPIINVIPLVILIKPDLISGSQKATTDSNYEQVKSMENTLKATERERFHLGYEKSELIRIFFEKDTIGTKKPDLTKKSVTQLAITDSNYEQVISLESRLKATERARFQLAYEKSELKRIFFEKANIVKGFLLDVLRDKQMLSDLLETEASLRIAETERVRELEMCLMAKQEEFAQVASNALAQLHANEVTIADLQCQLEQLKSENSLSTSHLETQLLTIERLKAEKEQLAEVSLAVLNARNSLIADLQFQLEEEKTNRQVPSIEVADEQKLVAYDPSIDWAMDVESDEIDIPPVDIRAVPVDIQANPVSIRAVPVDIQVNPDDIRAVPFDIQAVPVDIQGNPVDIRAVPVDIQANPVDIRAVPVDIQANPVDIHAVPEIEVIPDETNLFSYKVRNPVFEQEVNEEYIVSNISIRDYGRVVGKRGRRLIELKEKYDGLQVLVRKSFGPTGPSVTVKLIGADADSRRAAAFDITNDLLIEVDVAFCGLKLTNAVKKRGYLYGVKVYDNNDGSYCLSGTPECCEEYFDYLCSKLM